MAYDTNTIDITLLTRYKDNFGNEKSKFDTSAHSEFGSGYLNTCSDQYVRQMASKVSQKYDRIKTGYNSIDSWWSEYNANAHGLEVALTNEGNTGGITDSSVRGFVNSNLTNKLHDYDVSFANSFSANVKTGSAVSMAATLGASVAVGRTVGAATALGASVLGASVGAIDLQSPVITSPVTVAATGAMVGIGSAAIAARTGSLVIQEVNRTIATGQSESNNTVAREVNTRVASTVTSSIPKPKGFWASIGGAISGAASGVANFVGDVVSSTASVVGNAVSSAGNWIDNALHDAGNWLGNVGNAAWNGITSAGQWVGNVASSAWGGITSAWNWLWGGVTQAADCVWENVLKPALATIAVGAQSLVEGVLSLGEAVVDLGAMVLGGVVSAATYIGGGIATIGTGLYDGFQAVHGAITGQEWESATAAMWSGINGFNGTMWTQGLMPFVAEDWVGGAFDALYDNTGYGRWLKENSWGYENVRSVGKTVGYVAGIVAITVVTGGSGTVLLTAVKAGAIVGAVTFSSTTASSWANLRDQSWEGIERAYKNGEIDQETYDSYVAVRAMSDEEWLEIEAEYQAGNVDPAIYEAMTQMRAIPDDWKTTDNLIDGLGEGFVEGGKAFVITAATVGIGSKVSAFLGPKISSGLSKVSARVGNAVPRLGSFTGKAGNYLASNLIEESSESIIELGGTMITNQQSLGQAYTANGGFGSLLTGIGIGMLFDGVDFSGKIRSLSGRSINVPANVPRLTDGRIDLDNVIVRSGTQEIAMTSTTRAAIAEYCQSTGISFDSSGIDINSLKPNARIDMLNEIIAQEANATSRMFNAQGVNTPEGARQAHDAFLRRLNYEVNMLDMSGIPTDEKVARLTNLLSDTQLHYSNMQSQLFGANINNIANIISPNDGRLRGFFNSFGGRTVNSRVTSILGDAVSVDGTGATISTKSLSSILNNDATFKKFVDFESNRSVFTEANQKEYTQALEQYKQAVLDGNVKLSDVERARLDFLTSPDFANYAGTRANVTSAISAAYPLGAIASANMINTPNLARIDVSARGTYDMLSNDSAVNNILKRINSGDPTVRPHAVAALTMLDDINSGKLQHTLNQHELSNLKRISDAYNADIVKMDQVIAKLNQITDIRRASMVTTTFTELGVNVHIPKDVNTRLQRVTVADVERELAKLPESIRKTVKDVYIWDIGNAGDPYWARAYGDPRFKSAATGGRGGINIYSDYNGNLSETIAHEVGHNFDQFHRPTFDNPEGRISMSQDWSLAMWYDSEYGIGKLSHVSSYGAKSPLEDFAEAVMMYTNNRPYMEANFPSRLKVIEKYMELSGHDFSTPPSAPLSPQGTFDLSSSALSPNPDGSIDSAGRARINELAQVKYDVAKESEPRVTEVLKSLESDNARLVGLDYRLKGLDSLARKIETDAVVDGVSFDKAANSIGDSIRYTMEIDTSNYSAKVTETLNALEAQGYTVDKFKNTWGTDIYQGINVNLTTPDGVKMELQFHTPDSFNTKQTLNHEHYEAYRSLSATEAEKESLYAIMKANQDKVIRPVGAVGLTYTSISPTIELNQFNTMAPPSLTVETNTAKIEQSPFTTVRAEDISILTEQGRVEFTGSLKLHGLSDDSIAYYIKQYENAGILAGEKGLKGDTAFHAYDSHGLVHVTRVSQAAEDIGGKLSKFAQETNSKYFSALSEMDMNNLVIAGALHDIGMNSAAVEQGLKDIRKGHSTTSAFEIMDTLPKSDAYSRDDIALLAYAHSKSTSKIVDLMSENSWRKAIVALHTHNSDFDLSRYFVNGDINGEFIDGVLPRLNTQTTAIRLGDAGPLKSGFTQAGSTVEIKKNGSSLEPNSVLEAIITPPGEKPIALKYIKEAVGYDVLIGGEALTLTDYDMMFSATVKLGEGNVGEPTMRVKNGKFTLEVPVLSDEVPECTWTFAIGEKIGEMNGAGGIPKKLEVILPANASDEVYEFYKAKATEFNSEESALDRLKNANGLEVTPENVDYLKEMYIYEIEIIRGR